MKEIIKKGTKLVENNDLDQRIYLIEEMAELIQCLQKESRGKQNLDHIKEEISDVFCTLITYSISRNINFNEIKNNILKKYDRGLERLRNDIK